MRTINRRFLDVTFITVALAFATTVATPSLSKGTDASPNRPAALRAPSVQLQPRVETRSVLLTRAALAVVFRLMAPAILKPVLPLGVVVDDGVPF